MIFGFPEKLNTVQLHQHSLSASSKNYNASFRFFATINWKIRDVGSASISHVNCFEVL